MKACTCCGVPKPLSDFYRQASNADGLRKRCKECDRLAGAKAYARHREKYVAKRATPEYRAAYAEYWREYARRNAEQQRQKRRRYQQANAERIREYQRQYRVTHREQQRRLEQAWRDAHPEQNRQKSLRRRSRERVADGWATNEQITARVEFYGWRCAYCGGEFRVLDHVIPLLRGGSKWPANLRPACQSCNARKGIRTLGEWRVADGATRATAEGGPR